MTSAELLSLIQSDPTAMAFAQAGNDTACAERCTVIAPPLAVSTPVTEYSILVSLTIANSDTVLGKIETAAQTNATVKRLLKWMQPGAPGVDFSLPKFKNLLTETVANGGVGLTNAQAKNINDIQYVAQTITASMVGEAMRSVRKL